MKCLVISPDYASHASGLLEVASAARHRGHPVVFATGEAVRPSVEAAGVEWKPLRLGRGHNAGTIRVEEQVDGEDAHLREFFAATRRGPAAVLTYQALARQQDLLFEPDRVLEEIADLIDGVAPDRVVVDHIAFGATLALYAFDIPYTSVVLGHPTALPAEGELYGLPPHWPDRVRPSAVCIGSAAIDLPGRRHAVHRLGQPLPRAARAPPTRGRRRVCSNRFGDPLQLST